PRVDVEVSPSPLAPGERATVVVRARGADAASRVSASVDDRPIRLWPDPEPGVYRGEFSSDTAPRLSRVRATVSDQIGRTASTLVPVRRDVRHPAGAARVPLAMLASSHGGIDVSPDRIGRLEQFVRDAAKPARAPRPMRPMRSAWWLAPFATSLVVEWWL